MTTLEKDTVIVIDPDEEKAEKTRKRLEKSMKNIAVINTKCLSSHRQEIVELVSDNNYQKIFYGCSAEFFNEIVEDFNFKNGEVEYIGWKLDISKIVRNYWHNFWEKKDTGVFPSTVSKREGSYKEEL